MLKAVIFEDELDFYWEHIFRLEGKLRYRVFFDGKEAGTTEKTHWEFEGLEPQTTHTVAVETYLDTALYGTVAELTVTTAARRRRLDVTAAPYFAARDGKTLSTEAIQRALDDCGEGETVYFPAGEYLTGALNLHSGTELYIDRGATLQGSTCPEDYLPQIPTRFEGYERLCYRALLNAGTMDHNGPCNCHDITLRGGGRIRGGGKALCDAVIDRERERLKDYLATLGDSVKEYECDRTIPGRARPCLLNINNTRGFLLTRLDVGFGAAWNIHTTYSEDILISLSKISSLGVWNGDGWDPDSSERCTMYGCFFDTQDDAIAIKSGKNPEGNRIGRPCREICIFDCEGTQGIALGSEMSGGIENVRIWDCRIYNTVRGLRAKVTRKRGGYIRNVMVARVTVPVISVDSLYACNDDGEGADTPSLLENFYFEYMHLTGLTRHNIEYPPITVVGFPEPEYHVKNLTVRHVEIEPLPSGKHHTLNTDFVTGLTLEDVNFL